MDIHSLEVWLIVGSQNLYGPEVLAQVDEHARRVAEGLHHDSSIPVRVVAKPVLQSPQEIRHVIEQANASPSCIGLIAWMHTFSPAKMWISGLSILAKPLLHLHTQYNRDIPWSTIDMDFMNLNQSAHGGREFGHICARLKVKRKVIAGHWQDPRTRERIGTWSRAAAGQHALRHLRMARIGDNMRQVAVTEGDKVEAERILGFSVNTYGVGELVEHVNAIADAEIDRLCETYRQQYTVGTGGDRTSHVRDAARIELGLRAFLHERHAMAYTDTFEDLGALRQLPGIASQRLMADGYGFGAEGDWKTSALLHAAKVMAQGLEGGTSFMEDYTYHLDPQNTAVLGSHMLEICPSIAAEQPSMECHPLGIGDRDDPVRLVFTATPGNAVNASLIDMGDRFRLLLNEVQAVTPDEPTPKLPVARALWKPLPDFERAVEGWIYAGGAHHTVYSYPLGIEHFKDLGQMLDVETLVIA
ncbi:L-arabinose isomerase [Mucisphaera calidilacus]|uniref:L-arabinose isomerase n=1 Tax=Mucisphaera calidilacus TaxID=2527982 RepID=A0A518BX05_9BACT|nr:L-arabinose isomerase [Mucisphaera calidilacus]QDU71510.1 L-arabinose isomerase [Mucisphaera calidilacus]